MIYHIIYLFTSQERINQFLPSNNLINYCRFGERSTSTASCARTRWDRLPCLGLPFWNFPFQNRDCQFHSPVVISKVIFLFLGTRNTRRIIAHFPHKHVCEFLWVEELSLVLVCITTCFFVPLFLTIFVHLMGEKKMIVSSIQNQILYPFLYLSGVADLCH